MEDGSNETEVGQMLMDILLQKGEVEHKSHNQQQSNDLSTIRRNQENMRYDELIGAINVILEALLRQGKFTPHGERGKMQPNGPNCDQIDDNYEGHTRQNSKHTSANRLKCCKKQCTESMNRCLNSVERQLLGNINALNNQLTTFKPNFGKCKRSAYEDDHIEAIDENISPIEKRQTEVDTANEFELNKQNNYGVEREKYINYVKEEGQKFEYPTENPENNLNNESGESKQSINPINIVSKDKTAVDEMIKEQRSNGGGIDIPLRLVKGSDGRIKLVLDRRNICQKGRCRQRKAN